MSEATAAERPQTYGERAVGLSFNPSGNPAVQHCKELFASLIDQQHQLRLEAYDSEGPEAQEQARLASIAITELQGAQMWAVKALTWRN